MHRRFFAAAAILLLLAIEAGAVSRGKAQHVVVVVWDGMRPDLVDDKTTPALAALVASGVLFQDNHPAYPSSTNVNGAVLATGDHPAHNGIISNHEYRAEIDPRGPFDTSDFPALEAIDARFSAKFITVPTVAEIVRKAGYRTAIAGSKPVAQLVDRTRARTTEAAQKSPVLYRGKAIPASALAGVTAAIGPFPKRKNFPNDEEDAWTTRALTDFFWKENVPKFSLLWLSEPDLSQHETGPGSPTARAALKSSDDNLAKVLATLKAKGVLESTDLFVVSDHGFSTIGAAIDVAARLREGGFDAVRELPLPPRPGQILVISLGGSVEFYLPDHDTAVTNKLIDFLQRSEFAAVILTRAPHPGTFTLAEAHLDAPSAPDVLISNRWNDRLNEFGVPGEFISDLGKSAGQGSHSSLSPHDMNNLLVASGADFRAGWRDQTSSGNVDLAPTILWLLGLKSPHPMDGRVLSEAMRNANEAPAEKSKDLHAERDLGESTWCQTLSLATVGKTTYLIKGTGSQIPKLP